MSPEALTAKRTLRQFAEETDLDDPRAMAAAFAAELDSQDAMAVLELTLPQAFAQLIRELRQPPTRRSNGSSRAEAIKEMAASGELWLERFRVAFGDGTYKKLLECGPSDLRRVAGEHQRRERQEAARRAQYERLAELVERKRGARTVADLKPETVLEVLGG